MGQVISILSISDKVIEKLIYEHISDCVDENRILFERQFGFKTGSGTKETVINVTENMCDQLDRGYSGVAEVFIDYSKAFCPC